jgi:hypothetical protein
MVLEALHKFLIDETAKGHALHVAQWPDPFAEGLEMHLKLVNGGGLSPVHQGWIAGPEGKVNFRADLGGYD